MVETSGVRGIPRIVLRAEGAAIFALSLLLYGKTDWSWWLMVVLFLAPDVSFLGYLAGPRIGAVVYNAAHSLLGPLVIVAAGLLLPAFILVPVALIWTAHVGFDRLLGYGLKYGAGFGYTHLGPIGRASAQKI
jgi:hypothetical protein